MRKYLKFSSRIIVLSFFFYLVGSSSELVGTMSSPAKVYTAWDIITFIVVVLVMIFLGFMAGTEHAQDKKVE